VHYAVWVSQLLISSHGSSGHSLDMVTPVFRLWCHALKSPSMSYKHLTFTILSEILATARQAVSLSSSSYLSLSSSSSFSTVTPVFPVSLSVSTALATQDNQQELKNKIKKEIDTITGLVPKDGDNNLYFNSLEILHSCLSLLPLDRLRAMAAKRIWHEMEDFPSYSRFIQVIIICNPNPNPNPNLLPNPNPNPNPKVLTKS
jgi:hypothetical protein